MRRTRCDTWWWQFILILALGWLVACGGIGDLASSGGVGGTGVSGGGVGGTGISAGSISAIGSVHVNGVRFDTSDAEIFVEGQRAGSGDAAVLANLAVGMVVRVEGTIEDAENGTAEKVYFNDDLRGPVDVGSFQTIDATTAQLVVLGKTVIVNEYTNVIGLDIEDTLESQWIQVSGFEDAEGRLQATFVTGSYSDDGANLKGIITSVSAGQIMINGITIDTLGANLIGINQLAEGQHVEVTGTLSAAPLIDVDAETIERVDLLGTDTIDAIELEGIIAEKTSDTEFLLDGVPVVLDGETIYSGGDAGGVAEDVRVEVEGQLINGTLYAERVVFLSFAKVEADVAAIDPDRSMITLQGLSAIPIRYDQNTKVTGATKEVGSIDATMHVKIIGVQLPPSDPAAMLALHILTFGSLNNKVILQGALADDPPFDRTTITLLGHAIDISGLEDGDFDSPFGTAYEDFRDSTEVGDIISVKGTRAGMNVAWESVSVE